MFLSNFIYSVCTRSYHHLFLDLSFDCCLKFFRGISYGSGISCYCYDVLQMPSIDIVCWVNFSLLLLLPELLYSTVDKGSPCLNQLLIVKFCGKLLCTFIPHFLLPRSPLLHSLTYLGYLTFGIISACRHCRKLR